MLSSSWLGVSSASHPASTRPSDEAALLSESVSCARRCVCTPVIDTSTAGRLCPPTPWPCPPWLAAAVSLAVRGEPRAPDEATHPERRNAGKGRQRRPSMRPPHCPTPSSLPRWPRQRATACDIGRRVRREGSSSAAHQSPCGPAQPCWAERPQASRVRSGRRGDPCHSRRHATAPSVGSRRRDAPPCSGHCSLPNPRSPPS